MFELSLEGFIKSIVALFIIMDPFASLPVFLALTSKQSDAQKRRSAFVATSIAVISLAAFTLVGPTLMSALSISMPAFQIAGGILLLIISVQNFLGIEIKKEEAKNVDVAVVVVGIPLLTGPGAMTTAIILASQFGIATVFSAIAVVAFAILATLLLAKPISKLAGDNGIEILSKVASLLLAAIAVEFLKSGIFAIVSEWGLIPAAIV
ncbi:MAG: MarC family protein [Candidatus Micrarchaeia archaeon]